MRSIFATALLAYANASNVHEFFAESNFICGICQHAVEYAKKGDTDSLTTLYEMFPALASGPLISPSKNLLASSFKVSHY